MREREPNDPELQRQAKKSGSLILVVLAFCFFSLGAMALYNGQQVTGAFASALGILVLGYGLHQWWKAR